MRKMFIFLLIVGVLLLGTFSVAQEVCENAFQENISFSDDGDFGDPGTGGVTPDGGGGGGSGPIPG
jgi:hypothetical protein